MKVDKWFTVYISLLLFAVVATFFASKAGADSVREYARLPVIVQTPVSERQSKIYLVSECFYKSGDCTPDVYSRLIYFRPVASFSVGLGEIPTDQERHIIKAVMADIECYMVIEPEAWWPQDGPCFHALYE